VAGGDRSRADSPLIQALASGMTVTRAADDVGVSERTVYRRLRDPDFQAGLAQARTQRADRIAYRAAGFLDAGLGQLGRNLVDDAVDPHLGMTAAQFHLRRIQAIWVLTRLHLACRSIYRDAEIRELRDVLEGLEREVSTFRELYGLEEGGVDGQQQWAAPAG
jgi:hypothetical protein